jgi:sporulation protein YlmC with PRC-barrel domain
MRLCELHRKRVVGVTGVKYGRVHEVHTSDGAVDAIECGVGSFIERMTGKTQGRRIAWANVEAIRKDKIIIRDQ